MTEQASRRPPLAAVVLGYAGLLPPLVTIFAEVVARRHGHAARSVWTDASIAFPGLSYVALILSFLGGMWWGIAAARAEPARLWKWFAVAVLPSLVAFAAFTDVWLEPTVRARVTAFVLAAALPLSLVVDRHFVRAGLAPTWWMQLRIPLSCLLSTEALLIGALA